MTESFATTSPADAEEDDDPRGLTSDFVQECLGFHHTAESRSRKLYTLLRIRASLGSCGIGDDADDIRHSDSNAAADGASAAGAASSSTRRRRKRREEWRAFLEGRPRPPAEDDDGFGDPSENFMLRDSLVRCLAEGCRRGGGDADAGSRREDVDSDAMESSFDCLTRLVLLRCDDGAGSVGVSREKKRSAAGSPAALAPVFGDEFVSAIAPDVVEALKSDDADPSVPRAASRLLVALLRPDRPRNELCLDTVRDSILHPASLVSGLPKSPKSYAEPSDGGAPMGSVAHVARVLSASVIASVEKSVPDTGTMDEEELSMRRETAALNGMQDMRDVVMNVGLACSRGLGREDGGTADDVARCADAILEALQEIYDIAAFAVESQLETLLGDERAKPMLARLSRARSNRGLDKLLMDSPAAAAPARSATGRSGSGTLEESYEDDVEDGKEEKLGEATTLAPLYANLPKPPAFLTTYKSLESMLVSIDEKLNATDASLWDERLDALIELECILAGGVARMGREARHLFVEKLRRMPMQEQFQDLRSQITQQACRVLVAASYEYRDHVAGDAQLNQAVSHLVECCVFPSVLNLCKSGTRLMAAQGMNCLATLCAVCGSLGYPRTVPRYCEEILGDGKVHKNRKRGSVVALTSALRTWKDTGDCFSKNLDLLARATKEAATNRDPAVREEGRKLYWAMHACCDETERAVRGMFDERSRETKNLNKEREGIDEEWEEGGSMSALARTGVLGPKAPPKKREAKPSGAPGRGPSSGGAPPPWARGGTKRPASASSRFRAEHGTPFKARRASTPVKPAGDDGDDEAGVATAAAPSAGRKPRPPSKLSTPSAVKTRGSGDAPSAIEFSGRKSAVVVGSTPKIPRGSRLPSAANGDSAARAKSEEVVADPPRSALRGRNHSSLIPPKGASTAPIMQTPAKKSVVGFRNVNAAPSPGGVTIGTPIVNLLARASPLSAEKVRNTGDVLGTVLEMLTDPSPLERSLGIKALALFAKEEPRHRSWEVKFPLVLGCLLEQIRNMPLIAFEEPMELIRSPSKKNLSTCQQMQHLFLQGVRSLLQFVPFYVESEQVKDIICCMLECTKDAPFEIVHTAERALHNLFASADPDACFEHLLPFTSVEIDLDDNRNPPALLSALRTMRHLVDRISVDSLKGALPSLLPLFHEALSHKSVDMRKATVFVLVEMHFVLREEEEEEPGLMDDFTECQRRLVDVYIERHTKSKTQANGAETVVRSDGLPAQPIISA